MVTKARLVRVDDEIGVHGWVLRVLSVEREKDPGVLRGHVRLRVRRIPHGEHMMWLRPDDEVEVLSRALPPSRQEKKVERLSEGGQRAKVPRKGQLKLF